MLSWSNQNSEIRACDQGDSGQGTWNDTAIVPESLPAGLYLIGGTTVVYFHSKEQGIVPLEKLPRYQNGARQSRDSRQRN